MIRFSGGRKTDPRKRSLIARQAAEDYRAVEFERQKRERLRLCFYLSGVPVGLGGPIR